ncbi:MAG: sigma-70 family RNA polymerase sigma factor [Pseudomonadota bacterium]
MSVDPAAKLGPTRTGRGPAAARKPRLVPSSEPTLFEAIYAKYFESLVAFLAATFGPGPPTPEDTAQQAFENMFKTASLERAENPKAFLWQSARNLAISARKRETARTDREGQHQFLRDEGYHLTPDRVLGAEEAYLKAVEVIRSMPKQRKEAFLLVRFDGLSHTAAAAQLGISRPAVSKYVSQATAQLTEALT